jgi:hypothetical protein
MYLIEPEKEGFLDRFFLVTLPTASNNSSRHGKAQHGYLSEREGKGKQHCYCIKESNTQATQNMEHGPVRICDLLGIDDPRSPPPCLFPPILHHVHSILSYHIAYYDVCAALQYHFEGR